MKSTLFLFLAMLIIAVSCDQSQNDLSPSRASDRLSFKDADEFHKAYLDLAKNSYSTEQLEAWAASHNHSTMLNSTDTTIVNYSEILKTLFNKDGEVEIGGEVIWLNKGTVYNFSKDQLTDFSILKKENSSLKKFGEIRSIAISPDLGTATNAKTMDSGVEFNKVNAANQKEFFQYNHRKCNGNYTGVQGNRKYVHELFDETVSVGPQYFNHLFLRIKLEWKGSGGWKPASEQRLISYNISGWSFVKGSGAFETPFHYTGTYDCYSGPLTILINQDLTGPYYDAVPPMWRVNMDGVISQQIKGDDASNAWSNTECVKCKPTTSLLW